MPARSLARALGLALAIAALAPAACDTTAEDATCESVGTEICDRACACTEGPACATGDANGKVSFDSRAQCITLFVDLGCSQGGGGFDFATCAADLPLSDCVETSDGTDVLKLPASCE